MTAPAGDCPPPSRPIRIAVIALLVGGLLTAIALDGGIYTVGTLGDRGFIRTNRWTGKAWISTGGFWKEIQENPPQDRATPKTPAPTTKQPAEDDIDTFLRGGK